MKIKYDYTIIRNTLAIEQTYRNHNYLVFKLDRDNFDKPAVLRKFTKIYFRYGVNFGLRI